MAGQLTFLHDRVEHLQKAENEVRAVVDSGRIGDEAWDVLEARDLLDKLTRLRQEAEEVANYQEETKPPPVVAEDAVVLNNGEDKDEESQLLPRKKLCAQGPKAREDFFKLYDYVNEKAKKTQDWTASKEDWTAKSHVYREFAKHSGKRFKDIEREVRRVRRAMDTLNKYRIEMGEDHLSSVSEEGETYATALCDWILRVGKRFRSE